MTSGIYKITNKLDGKIYIGQSIDVQRRLEEHQKHTPTIDDYIAVIGKDNFDYQLIRYCPIEQLDEMEQYYISQYDSANPSKGYNKTLGGNSNSRGSNNGRAKLTENDIIFIRKAYNEHKSQKEIYKYFSNKITFKTFQSIWSGKSWGHIMPEVFTENNKKFYSTGGNSKNRTITNDELLNLRKEYVYLSAEEIWNNHLEYHNKLKKSSFIRLIAGDTKGYTNVPVYKKRQKAWFLQGNPVSTILESEE